MFEVMASNGIKIGDVVVVRDGESRPRAKMVEYVRDGIAYVDYLTTSGYVVKPYDRGLADTVRREYDSNCGMVAVQFGFDANAKYGALAPDSWCRLETYTRL